MIDVDYVRTMLVYGSWMNHRLLEASAAIPDSDRHRDLGAFFKSLHGTLDHLLWGDLIWMQRFSGNPVPQPGADGLICPTWGDLVEKRAAADAMMANWAENDLTAEWLAAPHHYVSKLVRRQRSMPAWVLVTHMLNHGTHHRGQATTLMKQLGVDPGVTDLVAMPALFDGSLGIDGRDEPWLGE
jgi:uncharacterized damage-inducible protein DinB